MESVSAFMLKPWTPKGRVFAVFTCMLLSLAALCFLQFKLFKPKNKDFYSFQVLSSKGKLISLEKYRGKILQRWNLDGTFGNIWLTQRVR
ncbi:putative glutathione peroxidase 8 isoform X2 [Mustelus asterias]